jgi:hypothetical protein
LPIARQAEIMRRIRLVIVLGLIAVTVGACGKKQPQSAPPPATTGTTATATPTASGTPTGTPGPVIEFSVDGAGPYLLGAKLADLQAAGQLDEVAKGGDPCPANTTAKGKGTWADVYLSFRPDGVLYIAINRSTSIPTPSGAWLGSSLTELKRIYAGVPGQDLRRGTASAYLVSTLSGRGILFELDPSQRVTTMTAGETVFLRSSFTGGSNFC